MVVVCYCWPTSQHSHCTGERSLAWPDGPITAPRVPCRADSTSAPKPTRAASRTCPVCVESSSLQQLRPLPALLHWRALRLTFPPPPFPNLITTTPQYTTQGHDALNFAAPCPARPPRPHPPSPSRLLPSAVPLHACLSSRRMRQRCHFPPAVASIVFRNSPAQFTRQLWVGAVPPRGLAVPYPSLQTPYTQLPPWTRCRTACARRCTLCRRSS